MKILPMQINHINQIVEIEKNSFSTPWSKSDFERELNENNLAIHIVALEANLLIGYAAAWHVVNECHIINLAVLPAKRRMGVGSALIEELVNIAISRDMIGLTLEVNVSNVAAQKLYSKFGFKPEGIRKGYYTDTNEDAIIMWKYFLSEVV